MLDNKGKKEAKMRKAVLYTGLVLLLGGIIVGFLAGAVLPGNVTIPLIYGSNQTLWLFVTAVGLIVLIVGAIMKPAKKNRK
jgi:F0F1-type ATP synthase membrane subunit c/vacuolar-type H+-ATPase subunit K